MKKIPMFYIVLSSIAVVALICSILVPEIGKLALLNELFNVLAMGSIIVMLIKALMVLIISRKISSILLVTTVILIICMVAGSKSIKAVKDIVSGPEWITISNCDLERRNTSSGIFSLNYYLKGEDSNGNEYRFSISGKEYNILNGDDEVTVLCYRNTGRIVEVKR